MTEPPDLRPREIADKPHTLTRTQAAAGGFAAAIALAVPGIILFEGTIHHGYRDPIGIVTSCTGHTGPDAILGRVYSASECTAQLEADLRLAEANIRPCIRVPISDKTRAAFISFSFNVGARAFCRSTVARDLNAGRRAHACAGLSRWVYAVGRPLPGLVRRRATERRLCEEGLR